MQGAQPDHGRDRGLGAGAYRLIAAQFASALADNALLIVTIALVVKVAIVPLMTGLGIAMAAAMAALMWGERWRRDAGPVPVS